jgi:predicted acylesterase/phospholipase RssA
MSSKGGRDPILASHSYDPHSLPDFDTDFLLDGELEAFSEALSAPTTKPVTALNDWRPIHQKIKKSRRKREPRRSKDETREGFVYSILYWPLLFGVLAWIVFLFAAYNLTRLYIYLYEHLFSWIGRRETLRKRLQHAKGYDEWKTAAQELDAHLGNDKWRESSPYSYYNHATVERVNQQLAHLTERISADGQLAGSDQTQNITDLKDLLEACIKNNFMGVENPRLYSETYFGTKDLVQTFYERVHQGLTTVCNADHISDKEKGKFFRHLELNFGRTALCLSGGATFAYYHFGVIKALLETQQLPEIITGTSGGALVAALVATRTDDELKQLLVPALAYRIRACHEGITTWLRRWWRTGARFDSLDWAKQSAWFCHGSLTFREAYERTGRILNVSCVPSDPHSPVLLNNHITSPDCVIWSAVLASAAVPGILNPIVLMRKHPDGTLGPYSFGNKWKDGSLRTDIPLKALNIHFNVNFSIVSQVNPHINLFFFSPRGSPGRPVSHRRGRGWRGGFLGSSLETAIKLDLQKYLKILKHLELLPRPLGSDWSDLWLQRFSGTITIWPKTRLSDFWYILSDPTPARLERMLKAGERSCWPRIKFISNRMLVENVILEGLRKYGQAAGDRPATPSRVLELQNKEAEFDQTSTETDGEVQRAARDRPPAYSGPRRQSSIIQELTRQASVLWDDDGRGPEEVATTDEEGGNDDDPHEAVDGL